VQGSGKTSFYLQRFFDAHVRISLDVLHTRHREQLLFAACLSAKQSFVVDNTYPRSEQRARYISPAIGYFFKTSLEDAIRRNNQCTGVKKIPTVALVSTFRKLQVPAKRVSTRFTARASLARKIVRSNRRRRNKR
jgi:hypothetical protein